VTYEIRIERAAARPIAAVRRRVRIGGVSSAWKPALDLVWAFLRAHEGIRTDGHNVFLYHHPARRDDPMDVDFGVEVTGPFDAEGEVAFTRTPTGEVASTLHVGSYDALKDGHDAIHAWSVAQGRAIGAASWEIYGYPTDDPAKLEVQIVYLLA
jgi:effector-binding domain-containing protein